jgi:uncharacterized coiled-coil protein SlyX
VISELSESMKKQSEVIADQDELISELTQRLERLEALIAPVGR